MDIMPWTALVFQSIPEEIILVTLGLALVGQYPRMKDIAGVGVAGAVFSFFLRRLPVEFGVHTLAGIIVLALSIRLLLKINFFRGLLATFLGALSIGICEIISYPVISSLTGLSFAEALHDPWLRVLFPLPHEIILGVLAYICYRRRFSLIAGYRFPDSARKDNEDEE